MLILGTTLFLEIEVAFGFLMSGISGFLYVIGALIALGAVVVGMFRSDMRFLCRGLFYFPIVILGFFVSILVNDQKMRKSEASLSLLLSHLKYSTAPPSTLSEIDEFPMYTRMGIFSRHSYSYSTDGEEYRLSFDLPRWYIRTYDSREGKWYTHD